MDTLLDENNYAIPGTSVVANVIVYRQRDGSCIVQLHEWSSLQPRQGNTNAALAWLRKCYPGIIIAHDCGHPGSESYNYWRHQLARGRVDYAYDDRGSKLIRRTRVAKSQQQTCLKLPELDVTLTQQGKNSFTVQYGQQVTPRLDYSAAAYDLGVCIMHALTQQGKLTNGG